MYYIAILAPDPINEQVLKWKQFMRDHYNCTVALKSPAHITLVAPFWMDASLQAALEQSLANFSKGEKRFPVHLAGFNSFKPRVIFVQVEESKLLKKMQTDLERFLLSTSLFPIKKTTREYHPHITIANRDLLKHDFAPAWENFRNKTYEAAFEVIAITLLKHDGNGWVPVYSVDLAGN